jgi:hypothetical protein
MAMKRLGWISPWLLGLTLACGAARSDGTPISSHDAKASNDAELGANADEALLASDGTADQGDDSESSSSWGIVDRQNYSDVVRRVVGMVGDRDIVEGAHRRGLSVLDVTWEDTGRAEGSSLGPNISDLTLQVRFREAGSTGEQVALMPVIRFPNFTDRTGDVPAEKFFVRIGNERGRGGLRSVPLTAVLKNLRAFASRPDGILGGANLLAPRDSHFLVSAQAVFLPIPKRGKAEFNPVVFNYQSAPGSPAVLTLLVTRQGTSMTVIENRPEEGTQLGWGQELYFNNRGQRAAFTAERHSDVKKRIETQGGARDEDDRTALERGADVLMLIQVPLKHRDRGVLGGPMSQAESPMAPMAATAGAAAPPGAKPSRSARSDVERAVLGHGRNRGPFSEARGLRLERDPRLPIRITVQFYKATSNGVADERDLDAIARSIGSVYEHADAVGSLVLPNGDPVRTTAWQSVPNEWFPW